MHKIGKRMLCLLLTAATLLSLTACNFKLDSFTQPQASEKVELVDCDRAALAYEQEYVRQHLDFLVTTEFNELLDYVGGMAAEMADHYQEAKLNYVNGFWKSFSTLVSIGGEGEVELVNEYEVLVAELMQTTGSSDSFGSTFQTNYMDAQVQMMAQISHVLKNQSDLADIFTGEELESIQALTTYLDGAIALLQSADGGSDGDKSLLFCEAMETIDSEFNKTYIKENEGFLDAMTGSLTAGYEMSNLAAETFSDLMSQILFYQALENTSQEWESVWEEIARSARRSDSEESKKIAECIDKLLEEVRSYRENSALTVYEAAGKDLMRNAAETGISVGQSVLEKTVEAHPLLRAIRDGLVGGVSLANALFNCDDIAYFGQMLMGYGALAAHANEAMWEMESKLTENQDYKSALLFNEAFLIYREVQIAASDCAINYYQAMIEAPVGYVFKYTTADLVAESSLILLNKSKWQTLRCHGIMQVLNNGGDVVGYQGSIYYIRYNDDSFERGGEFGNYAQNTNANNQLVCRSANGQETVLAEGRIYGGIYICGEKIAFQRSGQGWRYMDPQEGRELPLGTIVGEYAKGGMLICRSDDGELYATDLMGNSTDLSICKGNIIQISGDILYSYEVDENNRITIFGYNFATGASVEAGIIQLETPENSYSWAGVPATVVDEDGIYLLAGFYSGTGSFFSDGAAYFLSFADGSATKLVEGITTPLMYIAHTDAQKYLYFNDTDGEMGYGLYRGAYTKNVRCLNITTGEITDSALPLVPMNTPFILDGKIQILQNFDGECTILMDSAMSQTLGYGSLGDDGNGNVLYYESVDIVGDTCYIFLVDAFENTEYAFGWRTGYEWRSMTLYAIDMETGEIEVMNKIT